MRVVSVVFVMVAESFHDLLGGVWWLFLGGMMAVGSVVEVVKKGWGSARWMFLVGMLATVLILVYGITALRENR